MFGICGSSLSQYEVECGGMWQGVGHVTGSEVVVRHVRPTV